MGVNDWRRRVSLVSAPFPILRPTPRLARGGRRCRAAAACAAPGPSENAARLRAAAPAFVAGAGPRVVAPSRAQALATGHSRVPRCGDGGLSAASTSAAPLAAGAAAGAASRARSLAVAAA
eukprot:scaffold1235_cov358-Prasinococcus_capsulatus_cf.AAC.4